MPNGDSMTAVPQKVRGPDGKLYHFPTGTTKEKAIGYFKSHGIGVKAPTQPKAQQSEGEPIWQGFKEGLSSSFGVNPNDPRGITKQIVSGFGNSAVQHLKAFGPLAPFSMIASFIEDSATNLEKGVPEAAFPKTPKNLGHGLGLTVGTLGQLFAGAEGNDATSKISGSTKVADTMSKVHGLDPQNVAVAKDVANQHPSVLKPLAYGRAYIYKKGIDISNKLAGARTEIGKEIDKHAGGVSQWIDKNVPQGVVDPSEIATTIKDAWKASVQTPDKMPGTLKTMLNDAQKSAALGKKWGFEKAKQYRTALFDDMRDSSSPVRAVVGQTREALKTKLGAAAKQYGLEDSWNKYNKLQTSMETYKDHLNDVIETGREGGTKVAQKLLSNEKYSKEMAAQLSKYGLKYGEFEKFLKDAKWFKDKEGRFKSAWRVAHGTPGGAIGFFSVYLATHKWIPSMMVGAATGFTSEYITNFIRALRLHTDVLEQEFKGRGLEGKTPFKEGSLPPSGSPPAGASGTPTAAPSGPSLPGIPAPSRQLDALSSRSKEPQVPRGYEGPITTRELPKNIELVDKVDDIDDMLKKETDPEDRKWLEKRREQLSKRPRSERQIILPDRSEPSFTRPLEGVPRIPEGQHGTGRIAEQSKGRERAAKGDVTPGYERSIRAAKRRTERQAAMKAPSQKSLDLGQVSATEMEQFLEKANPTALSGLKKMLKAGRITDEVYSESLKHFTIEAYEKLDLAEPSEAPTE